MLRVLETLQALAIDFISLSEAIDTSTPAGKMTFTVLGAVAELERSLIIERVKAGLRNAQANGKKLGRLKRILNEQRISALRAQGFGWKAIAADMGVGVGTVLRHSVKGSKTQQRFLTPEPGVVSETVLPGLGRSFGSRHPGIEVSPHYKGRLSPRHSLPTIQNGVLR